MDQEKVGKFIAEKRKEKKLTQKELADKIGVTNKAISKWENGRGMPDCSFFKPLCEALDITVSELLSGQECSNDTSVVNYLQYKEKQHLKKMIILVIFIILIALLSLFLVYFVNSYKKINVYELNGESENFYYENGLIIKSNIKQAMQYGSLTSYTVESEDIISASLVVKDGDDYFLISNFTSNFIASEKYGYDEFFNDMKLEHIPNDMYIIIFYEKNDEIVREDLKIESSQVLSNDKFVNFKNKAEYTNDIKPFDLNQYDNIIELKKKAQKDGFKFNSENNYYLDCSKCVSKKLSKGEYVGFYYRNYLDTFRYYLEKEDFILKLEVILYENDKPAQIIFGFEGNNKLITYDLFSNEIICDEDLTKYEKYVKKAVDLFLKYNIT